jgi:hypothetical protein
LIARFAALVEDGVKNAGAGEGEGYVQRVSYNSATGDADGISEDDEAAICERAEQLVAEGGYYMRGTHTPGGQYDGLLGANQADVDAYAARQGN